MGLAYDNIKEYDKADECFKNILNIKPEYKKIIRKSILNLGVKYNRLKTSEITEKCLIEEQNIKEKYIPIVAREMINNKEIYADYFKTSKSLVFDQRVNINEIDDLMKKYEEWEKEGISKK